uniref:Myb/SANT-like domain-containing protein n=2 Tax=Oryza TaxID=4527 RepID=A0A0E0GTM3_ORYNI
MVKKKGKYSPGASGSGSGSGGGNAGGGPRPGGRETVVWSEKMNEYLIDALLHQQAIGNRGEGRFHSAAFDSIISGVAERFGVAIDRSNIKNRLKSIKENFHECENLFQNQSGFKWSAMNKKFYADPTVWREYIERKPEARKWINKPIDHYDRLLELFGKDRERCLASGSPKSPPAKKARRDPPKEKPQRTPTNGLVSPIVKSLKDMESQRTPTNVLVSPIIIKSSKEMVNENEVPSEAVTEINIAEEQDLSEKFTSENGAMPVEGMPYAPENWPCPGDQWSWKVGNRASATGHWLDRYLTPPSRFRDATGKKTSFTSRLKVEEFIKTEFPDMDPNTFFSMFIWKIPAKGHCIQRGGGEVRRVFCPYARQADPAGPCKARNNLCKLEREGFIESSPAQDCDLCCKMPDFCRECCCVFCRRVVDYSFGGYSYIKCEAVLEENKICGHIGHLDCALRTFMAGTVGGCIDLDMQYCCRRCDNKTNLMLHVEKFLEICQSLQSRDDIEPILNTGLCLVRGSRQTRAKSLESIMRSAMAKLKCGVDLAEVWKMEDNGINSTPSAEVSPATGGVTVLGIQQAPEEDAPPGFPYYVDLADNDLQRAVENLPAYITEDQHTLSVRFEDSIDHALKELKRSQEAEYKLAEQKLYSQKDHVLSLYRQLDSERSVLADPMPLADDDGSLYSTLITNVMKRVDQVKSEEEKLKVMLGIADGFGKTPSGVIQEHFGLPADTAN